MKVGEDELGRIAKSLRIRLAVEAMLNTRIGLDLELARAFDRVVVEALRVELEPCEFLESVLSANAHDFEPVGASRECRTCGEDEVTVGHRVCFVKLSRLIAECLGYGRSIETSK